MRNFRFLWVVVFLGMLAHSQEAASQKVVAKNTLGATLVPVNPDTINDYFNDAEAGYFGDRIAPVYDDPEWEYARILGEREKVIIAVNAKIEKRRKEREAIGVQFTPTMPGGDYQADPYLPGGSDSPLTQYGIASIYDKRLHGKLMSNGRPYNMYDPNIAAHWTLPLGTRVMVTDIRNGRSIFVTIQDRGPHPRLKRLIDLSTAASKLLAPDHSQLGLIRVKVTPLLGMIGPGKLLRPVPGQITRWPNQHGYNAVDFDGNIGDRVIAANTGKVVFSGWDGDYGNTIIVDHTNGLQTMYAHLNQRGVKTGDFVYRGQSIGTVGNTGQSRGSHLHFEVRISGAKVNPLEYLR